MKVVFRVDSATYMGSGHLMRCLTLAEALRERAVQIRFVCRGLPGNFISHLQAKDIPFSLLPEPTICSVKFANDYAAWLGVSQEEDAAQTISVINSGKTDLLVMDHYGLYVEWERRLRPYCDRLMVIDDLTDRKHDCDVLLNQNFSEDSGQRYRTLVPSSCNVLLGPSYALLRKEFQTLRQLQVVRPKTLEHLLVFFTAGDDQGETLKAMQGIAIFDKAQRVDIVIGKGNPDLVAIKAMCTAKEWGYHCQVDYMATLIAQADLVLGGGGSSNWERCALGVPALVVILAANQAAATHALDNAGVVINLGWNTTTQAVDYAKALDTMTTQKLASLSARAAQLVDANGAQRVVEVLFSERSNHLPESKRNSA